MVHMGGEASADMYIFLSCVCFYCTAVYCLFFYLYLFSYFSKLLKLRFFNTIYITFAYFAKL